MNGISDVETTQRCELDVYCMSYIVLLLSKCAPAVSVEGALYHPLGAVYGPMVSIFGMTTHLYHRPHSYFMVYVSKTGTLETGEIIFILFLNYTCFNL